ncbi:glycoside hydrolase family 140 protein [Jeotgalibaca caeni]|uniref:glycoside hydrolase family 140 protein n=1 Tax=Jeotgalibaca caeni TaxID=3028623 RepID=UPI00237D3FCA|nr:glycoside hydrolase family 140 protein [Jeotgalibaca caeni]MDE1549532.1 glycoside hydrolase family 140 protein [Jeotgalibaca caeni]
MQRLKVSNNKRFLMKENGESFFWLGDTAWELFHKLTKEDAKFYFENRSTLEFNVVQAVLLAEDCGLEKENAYGRVPLLQNEAGIFDPGMPDTSGSYSYWEHVDYLIDLAETYEMYVALLPTWGDKFNQMTGKGPVIFSSENAYQYGKWLGNRYVGKNNIIWVLGGDRELSKSRHFRIIQEMARGIREIIGENQLMTFHPKGGVSSSYHLHEEDWLDFNMIQSSHGDGPRTNYRNVQEDFYLQPIKPTIDSEPCYEDHPRGFQGERGYFDQADVRQAAYYAVFSGSFGHTYGHNSIWAMVSNLDNVPVSSPMNNYFIMSWKQGLNRPGAWQMRHLKHLMESFDFTKSSPKQNLIASNYSGANYLVALEGENCAFIYSPNGLRMNVSVEEFSTEKIRAKWFNPRNGEYLLIDGDISLPSHLFVPPTSGRGEDWVLVMEKIK